METIQYQNEAGTSQQETQLLEKQELYDEKHNIPLILNLYLCRYIDKIPPKLPEIPPNF